MPGPLPMRLQHRSDLVLAATALGACGLALLVLRAGIEGVDGRQVGPALGDLVIGLLAGAIGLVLGWRMPCPFVKLGVDLRLAPPAEGPAATTPSADALSGLTAQVRRPIGAVREAQANSTDNAGDLVVEKAPPAAKDLLRCLEIGDPGPRDGTTGGADWAFYTRIRAADDALRLMVAAVGQGADTFRDRVQRIGLSSTALSERAGSQAAFLAQTTEAVENLADCVRGITGATDEVERLVTVPREGAAARLAGIDEMVAIMDGLGDIFQATRRIVGRIDDTAVQTDLVALDAGGEAARAGVAGRGGAVVAPAVRGPARPSLDAAQDTRGLIERSSDKADAGAALVGGAGGIFRPAFDRRGEAAARMASVTRALEDRSAPMSDVTAGTCQLDYAIHQGAGLVEEIPIATGLPGRETEQGMRKPAGAGLPLPGGRIHPSRHASAIARAPGRPWPWRSRLGRTGPLRSSTRQTGSRSTTADGLMRPRAETGRWRGRVHGILKEDRSGAARHVPDPGGAPGGTGTARSAGLSAPDGRCRW